VGNIFAILKRFSHFFVFMALQIICFKMLYNGSPKHHESIGKTTNKFVGTVQGKKEAVTNYFFLKEVNDSLLKENERLRKSLLQEIKTIPITDSNGTVTYTKDSVEKTLRYHYFAAKVLDRTFDEPNNYLTIDRGAYQGIKKGMAVLSNNGIVGRVLNTSAHFSIVKCVISDRFKVSAQLKDGTLGYISWPEVDSRFVMLNDISPSINVKQGDTVYTSTSSLFPPNIPIGRVAALKQGSEANHYKVLLSTNFRRLHYVYVVEDMSADEMQAIIDTAKNIDKPFNPKGKK
jgi:rod shape-determining protein MreC